MEKNTLIKLILIGIVGFLAGFMVGYGKGAADVGNYVVHVALALQEKGLLNIEIDKQFVEAAVFQYKNNVAGCLFIDNSSLI